MLQAVTFDFWDTLVRDTPEGLSRARARRVEVLAEALRQAGCPRPASMVEEAYEISGREMANRFWSRHRDCSIQEQVQLCLECVEPGLAARLAPEELQAAVEGYSAPVLVWPPVLLPGAEAAVRRLAARGLALGIASNTGRTPGAVLRRLLGRFDLLRCFRAISYSDEVGRRKPDAEIFRRTLERLAVPPARALHVGDNPHDDVMGARRVGMRAAHYTAGGRPPAAEADLVIADLGELPRRLGG